jgi:hypothetical protein
LAYPGTGSGRRLLNPRSSSSSPQQQAGQPSSVSLSRPAALVVPQSASRARALEEQQERMAAQRPRKPPAPLFDELNWDNAVIERLNPKDLTTKVIRSIWAAPCCSATMPKRRADARRRRHDLQRQGHALPVAKQTRWCRSRRGRRAGVYQLVAGETLRHLIARLGGFTRQAYVYGIEFSREETRKSSGKTSNAAVSAAAGAGGHAERARRANRRDDPSDRSASVSNTATQAQLARIAQLQPNGRIALECSRIRHPRRLPEVPLENGDRIIVPPRPASSRSPARW